MTEEESAMYQNSPLNESVVSAVPQLRDRTKTKSMKHAGDIALDDVIEIARIRSHWSKAKNFSGTVKEILGTCLSLGCTVDGEDPNKLITEIDSGDLELPEEGSAVPSADGLVIMALKKPERDRTKTKSMKHAGDVALDDVIGIAQCMSPWSMAKNFSGTVKEILGTCVSLGCTVDGEDPNDVITQIDNGDLELPEEPLLGYSSMETKEKGVLMDDSDNSFEEDDDLGMTDEEKAMYEKSLEESDGFDVIYFPSGVEELGVILPINIERRDVLFYTKMAIEVFNKSSHKEAEGELVFDKVLKAMGQAICGLRFYLTFDAKNLHHNEIRTYQAIALCGAGRDDEVESFRAMPSGSKKEWFWATHLSCC